MKRAGRVTYALMSFAMLFATTACTANRGSLYVQSMTMAGKTQLPAGEYTVQWEGAGPDVELKIKLHNRVKATVPAKVTPLDQPLREDAAVLNTDGNGSIVTLPPLSSQAPLIPDAAVAAYGTLTLGIGTETNNQPPVGLAVCDTGHGGDLNTVFDGTTLGSSYLDTGTDVLSFSSYSATGLPACASPNTGFYCPAHTTSFSAVISGRTIGSSSITFPVGNAATYLASNPGQPDPYALDAIAEPGSRRTFVWGGPFFFGRSVYIAIDGSTTILGPGPYFAF